MCFLRKIIYSKKGFTVVELVVVMFIMVIVISAVVSTLQGALAPTANNTVNTIQNLTGAGY